MTDVSAVAVAAGPNPGLSTNEEPTGPSLSIDSLPDEILSHIFSFLPTPMWPDHPHLANTISAVSKRWRSCAASTKTLWTIFCIYPSNHAYLRRFRFCPGIRGPLDVLDEWVGNSGNLPLDVTLYDLDQMDDATWNYVSSNMISRCGNLIVVPFDAESPLLLSSEKTSTPQRLETIVQKLNGSRILRTLELKPPARTPIPFDSLQVLDLPRLTHLTLNRVSSTYGLSLHLPNLQLLSMSSWKFINNNLEPTANPPPTSTSRPLSLTLHDPTKRDIEQSTSPPYRSPFRVQEPESPKMIGFPNLSSFDTEMNLSWLNLSIVQSSSHLQTLSVRRLDTPFPATLRCDTLTTLILEFILSDATGFWYSRPEEIQTPPQWFRCFPNLELFVAECYWSIGVGTLMPFLDQLGRHPNRLPRLEAFRYNHYHSRAISDLTSSETNMLKDFAYKRGQFPVYKISRSRNGETHNFTADIRWDVESDENEGWLQFK